MDINEVVTQALQANFSEFTEDQAAAVIEAIKANGFVLVSSLDLLDLTVMINWIDLLTIGKRPAEVGYHMVSIGTRIQEMFEAQEPAND